MTGPLLKSGTLTEFEPLGAGGETLFGSAPELRVAIQRRLGADVAGCFAVPQQNAYGDTLDWYAPERGPVTPWANLSDEQRTAVREHVEDLRRKVVDLSRELVDDDKRDRQIFGRLLEHATTIPDDSHIFLVAGRPVLAFWGFRLRKDPTSPLFVGQKRISRTSDTKIGPEYNDRHRRRGLADVLRRHWWLLAILVIAVPIGVLMWHRMNPASPSTEETPHPPVPVVQAPPAPKPLDFLVIPPEAIETGSMNFLTGRWQANSDELVDSDSKRPISLAYELDKGIGEVAITEQAGTVCRAPIDAAFDGETLTLTPRGAIRCPSRAPFYGVTVTCRPSTDRRALCTGSFPNGKVFRVELGRHQ